MTNPIFKGDNTGAFDNQFITIKIENPYLYKISKILFVINSGAIIKEYTDANYFQVEEITLTANFNSDETKKLTSSNIGNLVVYDEIGRQLTCNQTLKFSAQNGVLTNGRCY